ncbi:MAG: type II secretion system protein GspG [Archangiaceae bacterium]|nr:type II secretion system protein GspG [Archangiaceae bacterium]
MKTNKTQRRRARGFTLLEILVVIAILGLLTGMVAVAVVPTFSKAKVDTTRTNIGTTMDLLKQYYLRKNKYPDTGTGLKALVDEQITDKIPRDPWNNDFLYMLEGNKPVVISYGDDGTPGGEGNSADLSSKDDLSGKK